MYVLLLPSKTGGDEFVPRVSGPDDGPKTIQWSFTYSEALEMKEAYLNKLKGLMVRTSVESDQVKLNSMIEGVRIAPLVEN